MADPLLRPANPITPIVDDLALLGQRLGGEDQMTALAASIDILALYGALRAAMPVLEARAHCGDREAARAWKRSMKALMRTEAKIG